MSNDRTAADALDIRDRFDALRTAALTLAEVAGRNALDEVELEQAIRGVREAATVLPAFSQETAHDEPVITRDEWMFVADAASVFIPWAPLPSMLLGRGKRKR